MRSSGCGKRCKGVFTEGCGAPVGVSIAVAAKFALAQALDQGDILGSAAIVLPVRNDQVQGKVPLLARSEVYDPVQHVLREFLCEWAPFHPAMQQNPMSSKSQNEQAAESTAQVPLCRAFLCHLKSYTISQYK